MQTQDNDEQRAEPLFVSIKESGRIAGLSPVTIYRLIAGGHLRAAKAGSKTLVELASVKAYLAALPRFVGRTGQKRVV
jgi:excisionase family DNA binding protein